MRFKPHSLKQERALFSKNRIVLLATGIQYGKTTVGSMRMKMAMHTHIHKGANFLITAPTYKIMHQSTLPAFLRVMDGFGVYSKAEATFKMHSGGTCYLRTATDPDSIVGITDIYAIWGDEAGLYPLYFWENLQARAAFKEAPITLTTSPYSLNWVFKEIIKPKKRDGSARPDVDLFQAASEENPFFPKAEIERQRSVMDPRRFNMIYGGQFDRMEGLVYDCFNEGNIVSDFRFPRNTRYVAGVDWGHNHPFALVVRAITPDGLHVQVSETYLRGLSFTDMVTIALEKKKKYNVEIFYCDPSQPGLIEEFNRAGATACGADNDIRRGIDMHYELIKTKKYLILEGSGNHTIDEMETYHYPSDKDLGPDTNDKDMLPVKQTDDLMDANRYVTISTYHSWLKKAPRVPINPDESQVISREKHYERLIKGNRPWKNSENWS